MEPFEKWVGVDLELHGVCDLIIGFSIKTILCEEFVPNQKNLEQIGGVHFSVNLFILV